MAALSGEYPGLPPDLGRLGFEAMKDEELPLSSLDILLEVMTHHQFFVAKMIWIVIKTKLLERLPEFAVIYKGIPN